MILFILLLLLVHPESKLYALSASVPTVKPTTPCQNVISFMSTTSYVGQELGLCYNFTFSANAGTLQLCGYNITSKKRMSLWNKDGGYAEQGIGLKYNVNHEIEINTMIQVNMGNINIKTRTIPTFNMGSTGGLDNPPPVLGVEWYCLYGSNVPGERGKDFIYTNYLEGVDIPFPSNYSRYKYIAFTACSSNKNKKSDVLLQKITITDGWACTGAPTFKPTALPTVVPTRIPSSGPSITPTQSPSVVPTYLPSNKPTVVPTYLPSNIPTVIPSFNPTFSPTIRPTLNPSITPTFQPSFIPTITPSIRPSIQPTVKPSAQPSVKPTTFSPSRQPNTPTILPTVKPTFSPSVTPTYSPSFSPSTFKPSVVPTFQPTTFGNKIVPQCLLSTPSESGPTFQGFFIIHQLLNNVNKSFFNTNFNQQPTGPNLAFIQSVQCSLTGQFSLRTVNVTITDIESINPHTSNSYLKISYFVEYRFPVPTDLNVPNAYNQLQTFFQGLVIQMTEYVQDQKFTSIFQEFLLLQQKSIIELNIHNNNKDMKRLMTINKIPENIINQITSIITPKYFGPYLKTIVPSKAPVTNIVQSNSLINTSFIYSNLALIIGTVTGVLLITCCILLAYCIYLKRKREREDDMLKWTEDDISNIHVFKKYDISEENPAFGSDVIKGRGLSIIGRTIDAVRRFSIRDTIRNAPSLKSPIHNKSDDNNEIDIGIINTAMNINTNIDTAYSNSDRGESVFSSAKYIPSNKGSNRNKKSFMESLKKLTIGKSNHHNVYNYSSHGVQYPTDEEDGVDYSFHTHYGNDDEDDEEDIENIGSLKQDGIKRALNESK